MANVTPTLGVPDPLVNHKVVSATWAMGSADTGLADSRLAGYADRTVQAFGTWGGATLVIEGSLDGTNWVTLTDPQGNAISKTTTNFIESIAEWVRYIRPVTSGGTGTALTVIIAGKNNS